nr:MAG TPA: hypothetical protein [Caudoviricetes sp.]
MSAQGTRASYAATMSSPRRSISASRSRIAAATIRSSFNGSIPSTIQRYAVNLLNNAE